MKARNTLMHAHFPQFLTAAAFWGTSVHAAREATAAKSHCSMVSQASVGLIKQLQVLIEKRVTVGETLVPTQKGWPETESLLVPHTLPELLRHITLHSHWLSTQDCVVAVSSLIAL